MAEWISRFVRNVLVLVVVSAIAYALGASNQFWREKPAQYELADAIPPSIVAPFRSGNCVAANEHERALVKIAVDALALPFNEAGSLVIGAEKFLSRSLTRRSGQEFALVCTPTEEYERAGQALADGDFNGRLVEYQLNLIAKLPNPSEAIAKAVAASAFNDSIQQSEGPRLPLLDIRPIARATLAGLGPLTQPYASKAFDQISIDDAMGTGAAQIAVAGGHPAALETVARLMADKLASLPRDRVIPRDIRNRLYEMAYALTFGAEKAEAYSAPLKDLMSRKVQSWAPPFGMIELPPRRMCRVLAGITHVSVTDLGFDYCSATDVRYEQ